MRMVICGWRLEARWLFADAIIIARGGSPANEADFPRSKWPREEAVNEN